MTRCAPKQVMMLLNYQADAAGPLCPVVLKQFLDQKLPGPAPLLIHYTTDNEYISLQMTRSQIVHGSNKERYELKDNKLFLFGYSQRS